MEIPNKYYIVGLLVMGFLVRMVAFQSGFMFTSDVNLFQYWGQILHQYGLNQIYHMDQIGPQYEGFFIDYPPGYLYVLYTLGALAYRFGWERLDTMFNFVTFLPAILADLGIGYIIYRIAAYGRLTKVKGEERPKDISIDKAVGALIMSALWILNPAILLISSVWGQVESVFVLFLLLSLVLLREKKLLASYLLFGVAIIVKAQSLFLGPVYLYSAFSYLQDNRVESDLGGYKISGKSVKELAIAIGAAAVLMVLLALPFTQNFNIIPIIELYTGVMGTHPRVTVNAFNFWALLGRNWDYIGNSLFGIPYMAWGLVFVLAIIVGTIAALHRDHTRHGGRHYYFIVGALLALIFIFSIRMHERYLFPALLFFLLYYVQTGEKRGLGVYAALSVTFFFNCTEVLRWLRGGGGLDIIATSTPIISFANVAVGGLLIYMLVKSQWMEAAPAAKTAGVSAKKSTRSIPAPAKPKKARPAPLTQSESVTIDPPPMSTRDYVLIFGLIIVYSIIAFARLGDTRAPQSSWTPVYGETATIDLGSVREVNTVYFRIGPWHEEPFTLDASDDNAEWQTIHQFTPGFTDVFSWQAAPLHFTARYIRIRSDAQRLRIQEIAFRGPERELLPIRGISPGGEGLVDEQHLVPEYRTFMNSAYFDEVYHPRSAYEKLNGLQVWENTHPPMGKNFIAMSVRIFGMTPFGWRFAGTFFGVLMVPLIYAFARFLLKSNDWAFFTATLFTFDFMHFAQTRLATIDSYVTFFIIAMYFFMYLFIHGVERDSLRRKLIILALCGASVGLAAASKWQGLYAILGLPIVFFPALYRLYLRDRKQAEIIFYSCFGFFIALPITIYLLSYIPYVATINNDLGFIRNVWSNQTHMHWYHCVAVLGAEHPFRSPWWEWPLNLRPIWLYSGRHYNGNRSTIASFGNPAVYWVGIVATWYVIIKVALLIVEPANWTGKAVEVSRPIRRDILFLLTAYFVQMVPWIGIARLTWIYHYFPSVPFVVLIIGWAAKNLVDSRPNLKPVAVGYACLVVALFALFYPVLSGLPVSSDFIQTYLQWLPRWHF